MEWVDFARKSQPGGRAQLEARRTSPKGNIGIIGAEYIIHASSSDNHQSCQLFTVRFPRNYSSPSLLST